MNRSIPATALDIRETTLENDLRVMLIPRSGFKQTFAMFATKYGSIDNEFVVDGKSLRVPDGIAHFLEHKMFEDERQDVFAQFAEHGASVNAFTTFDQTAYYFSGTSDLKENLDVLLDFVQHIYLTDENVEKEKGIIAEEIRMGQDNPDQRVYREFLAAMYKAHPVRIDIAGSVESIYQITRQDLLDCYHTFYHPSNMMLVMAGGFDADAVLAWIEENQAKKSFSETTPIERTYPPEPEYPETSQNQTPLSVAMPRCLIGWKDRKGSPLGQPLLRQELLTGIVMDTLFGKTSEFYAQLLEAGLIDKGFSWEYELTAWYGYSVIGGNSPNPDALVDHVRTYIEQVRQTGVDEEAFHRARKKAIGRFIASLDHVSYVVRSVIAYRFRGVDFLDTVDVLEGLTRADANARLLEHFDSAQMVVSTIVPKSVANH